MSNWRNLGFDLEIMVCEINSNASPRYADVEIRCICTTGYAGSDVKTSSDVKIVLRIHVVIPCTKLARRLPVADQTALSLASKQSPTLIPDREGKCLPF